METRCERELEYGNAQVFQIYGGKQGGLVMCHMIYAFDHPEAFHLMVRASFHDAERAHVRGLAPLGTTGLTARTCGTRP